MFLFHLFVVPCYYHIIYKPLLRIILFLLFLCKYIFVDHNNFGAAFASTKIKSFFFSNVSEHFLPNNIERKQKFTGYIKVLIYDIYIITKISRYTFSLTQSDCCHELFWTWFGFQQKTTWKYYWYSYLWLFTWFS